jgi:hypothetical protein
MIIRPLRNGAGSSAHLQRAHSRSFFKSFAKGGFMNPRELVATIGVSGIIAFVWWNPTAKPNSGYFTVTLERMLESVEGSILYSDAFGLEDLEFVEAASQRAQHAILKLQRREFDLDQPLKMDA